MSVKDYFKLKPEGFDEKDVYVCESRYSSKARAFKKIKVSFIIILLSFTILVLFFYAKVFHLN